MRLTGLIVLFLWLIPMSNSITAKPDETPLAATVLFESYGTFIFVPVRVNNSPPLSFIFDTGFNRTVINPKLVGQLRVGQSKEVHGGPFKLTLTKGKRPTLQIGNARLKNVENLLSFFSFDDLEEALGRHVDGIFGSDLLQRYVVEIDYASRTLNLYDPKSYHYAGSELPIPLQIKNRLSFIQCEITPNNGAPLRTDFELDTGSDGTIDLPSSFIQQYKVEIGGPTLSTMNWTAMAGEQEDRVGRLKAIHIGRFTLNNPLAVFSASTKQSISRPFDAGLLGGEILKRFKLILDYSHKWIILEPNGRLNEPFEWDMTGLDLDAVGNDFSTYVVSNVLAQSPAAEAGVQKGDRVIAINGTPASTLGLREIERIFKEEGHEVRLEIKRNEQILELKLKLRRLI